MREGIERFLATVTSNFISLSGSGLTTVSAFLFLLLFIINLVSEHGSGPYLGILAFLVLPALFVLGLLLIPLGIYQQRRRHRQAIARGEAEGPRFAILDFNRSATRKAALVFLAATGVNALIVGTGTYKAVEVMESTEFCGATCHTVMQPEYTTYRRSPHARVACVECHIGSGANWFVRSKLSGSWQVVAVAFNLYPRPIAVPVHNLRPARETCEQCHWPAKFVGDRLKVRTHYEEDEANTEVKTVLVVKVGGEQAGNSHGIHWHVDPDHTVRYRADEKRDTVYEVEMTVRGGATKRFKGPAADKPEAAKATAWRTVDCVDCHNRPTHIYRSPADELDAALLDRRIDPGLPFVRREGLKALETEYPSHAAAREGIAKAVGDYYAREYPQLAKQKAAAVTAAGNALGDIWCWNVFPEMNIKWGTYTNHLGHPDDSVTGCFRCHGGDHASSDGETISADCDTCHTVLAEREKDPAVLKTLLE